MHIGAFRNSLVVKNPGLLNTTQTSEPNTPLEVTRKDRKNAKFISDKVFGNNLKTSDGTFNTSFLFLLNAGTFGHTLEALQPLIHANYKKNNKVRDDLEIHVHEIDLNKSKEDLKSELLNLLKANNTYSHVFVLKLKNGNQENNEKLQYMLHIPITSDRAIGSNLSRTLFITDKKQLFEDLKANPKLLHTVSIPKWFF